MGLFDVFKPKQTEPQTQPPVTSKILVVDDDQLLRTYYHDLLVKSNYEVTTAINGKEALQQLSQSQPDLILLDIVMPEMDGKMLLKQIRAMPTLVNIPVIMLTSAASVTNMEETDVDGANGFLNKNVVTPEEILSTIQGALVKKPKLTTLTSS